MDVAFSCRILIAKKYALASIVFEIRDRSTLNTGLLMNINL